MSTQNDIPNSAQNEPPAAPDTSTMEMEQPVNNNEEV